MATLRERTIDFGKEYSDFFYKKSDIEEFGDKQFEDLDSAKKLVKTAKKLLKGTRNEKTVKSFLYLYKVVERMAIKYFWKFLGPNTKSQYMRIANGDDTEYLSMCTESLSSALNAFDPDLATTVSELKGGLQFYFRGYVKANTERVNKGHDSHGIIGADGMDLSIVNPDSFDVDGNSSAWDTLGIESSDDENNYDDDYFTEAWKNLANDEDLHKKNKQWHKILAAILKGDSVDTIAKNFGISKNTVREKFFSTTHNRENGNQGLLDVLLKRYNIPREDLADNLRKRPGFLISTLEKSGTN